MLDLRPEDVLPTSPVLLMPWAKCVVAAPQVGGGYHLRSNHRSGNGAHNAYMRLAWSERRAAGVYRVVRGGA